MSLEKEYNMKKGNIKCECGTEMFVETIFDSVNCIKCGEEYSTSEFEEVVEIPEEEYVEE